MYYHLLTPAVCYSILEGRTLYPYLSIIVFVDFEQAGGVRWFFHWPVLITLWFGWIGLTFYAASPPICRWFPMPVEHRPEGWFLNLRLTFIVLLLCSPSDYLWLPTTLRSIIVTTIPIALPIPCILFHTMYCSYYILQRTHHFIFLIPLLPLCAKTSDCPRLLLRYYACRMWLLPCCYTDTTFDYYLPAPFFIDALYYGFLYLRAFILYYYYWILRTITTCPIPAAGVVGRALIRSTAGGAVDCNAQPTR